MTVEKAEAAMEAGLSVLKFSLDALNDEEIKKIRGKRADFDNSINKIHKIIEIKKYKPPNHCVVERHSIKLSFKCLRFSKIVNPVDVKPETASK